MKTILAFILSSVFLVAASQAERTIQDLQTQISGTDWKAAPGPLRPGMAAELTFADGNVQPAGYRYEVNSNDSLTITFNHGGTQKMTLDPDGRHLTCLFQNRPFSYALFEERHQEAANALNGSQWRAIPLGHTHPGLVSNLTFSQDTVAPQGYQYDVNADNSITIHFNHGGTFLMLLSGDGHHLSGIFKNQKYQYERVPN